jgi:exonuclease SbcD
MNFIHTADWHLGQKLVHQYREEEHDAFLSFLLAEINKRQTELLIVAGDIFDNGNPPNFAVAQYFDFLTKLLQTKCRNVVIVGGNHDSVSNLNSPKKLLQALNIHVTGGVSENYEEDIISINNSQNELTALVCAIPFLRERDLRVYEEGENDENRKDILVQRIAAHYQKMARKAEEIAEKKLPIIATGHLFMTDSEMKDENEDSEREIYIGNLGNVATSILPPAFHYVALGHIHKQQKVGGKEHIRYSGSPIPLSFSERNYHHVILSVDVDADCLPVVTPVEVPLFRRLIRFEGSIEEIKNKVEVLDFQENTAWAECIWEGEDATSEGVMQHLENHLKASGKNIELFKVSKKRLRHEGQMQEDFIREEANILDSPSLVFDKFLERKQFSDEQKDRLKAAFLAVLREHSQS